MEDLISPVPHHTLKHAHLSRTLHQSLVRGSSDADSDMLSVHSLRASVLSRTIPTSESRGQGRDVPSSGSSIRSVVWSTAILTPTGSPRVRNYSTTSRASERPDSKLMPDSASFTSVRTEKGRAHGCVVGHCKLPSVNTTSTHSMGDRASEKDVDGEDDDHDGASTPTPLVTTTERATNSFQDYHQQYIIHTLHNIQATYTFCPAPTSHRPLLPSPTPP